MQPYLGKRAHLSLSWLTHPLLSLILIIVSLLLLLSTIQDSIATTKAGITGECKGVEGAMGVVGNLPHYMADGVNDLNRKAVIGIIEGAGDVLELGLLGIEGLVIFIIDMYQSLFLCLLNLAVHGSLDLLIAGTEEAQLFVTAAFNSSRIEIQHAIAGLNSGLDTTIAALDKIPLVHIATPSLVMPTLSSLSNVTIPSSILQSLIALNSSLPTLSQLRTSLDAIITTPIEAVRHEIKSTISNSTTAITIQTLPVPDLTPANITYCQNLNLDFIDEIGRDLIKFVKLGLIVILVLIILLFIAGFIWANYEYNSHLRGVKRAKSSWQNDLQSGTNPADSLSVTNLRSFLAAADHPTLHIILSKISNLFNLSNKSRTKLHWFGNYIFHQSAFIFLMIGVLGLLFIQIQLALLAGPMKTSAQKASVAGLRGVSSSLIGDVNQRMNASSIQYASQTNSIIQGYEDKLNHDLFGWVNVTTTTLNTTIETFYNGLTSTVNQTFYHTPFDNAALALVNCLLGSKVLAISKALTFLNNNSHITLPRVSPSVLLLSPNRTTELTSSISNSTGKGGGVDKVVDGMILKYEKLLISQRIGFIICLVIWLIVFICGIIGVCWKEETASPPPIKNFEKSEKSAYPDFIPLSRYPNSNSTLSPPQYHSATPSTFKPKAFFLFNASNKPDLPLPPLRVQPPSTRQHSIKRVKIPTAPILPIPTNFQFKSITKPSLSSSFSPKKAKGVRRDQETIGLASGSYSDRNYPGSKGNFLIGMEDSDEEADEEGDEGVEVLGEKMEVYRGYI